MQIQPNLLRGSVMALTLMLSASALCAQAGNRNTNEMNGADVAVLAQRSSIAPARASASNAFTPAPLPLPRREISRKKAIVLGIVIGGAVGATAGYLIANDSCDSCDDSAPVGLVAGVSGLAGAALGGFVAAQNVPPGTAQSALRSTQLLNMPRPVMGLHLATFR